METVTVAEAAAEVGLTKQTVLEAIRADRLPATRHPKYPHPYLIARTDLTAWSAARRSRDRRAERLARISDRITTELAVTPRTRAELRARMSGASRGGGFTTVLAQLIDAGAVIDPGRGEPLRLAD